MVASLAQKYNLGTSVPTGLDGVAKDSPDEAHTPSWWHPSSPLFALFALAAVTFGLIGASVSGSGRVGPFHASGDIGAGKTGKS